MKPSSTIRLVLGGVHGHRFPSQRIQLTIHLEPYERVFVDDKHTRIGGAAS